MKIISQNDTPNFSLPLPIFHSIHLADAVGRDGEEFTVFVGLDKNLVAQVKKYSMDEEDLALQEYTKDRQRFVEGSYEDWYKKNRTPFALVHKRTDVLAAIVRFGPEPLFEDVDSWHTIGWRSYGVFRGKGLMKGFTKFAMDVYTQKFPNIKFWITAQKENKGSVRLATDLGFEIDQEKSEKETLAEGKEYLVMVL